MPIHFEYDATHRILTFIARDPVSISDWLAARDTIQLAPSVPATTSRLLLDLRQRQTFLTQKKLVMLINNVWRRTAIPDDYWIAVAVSSDLGYGIGRMLQGHAEEYDQIQVFRDLRVAQEWLKVQPAVLPPRSLARRPAEGSIPCPFKG